MKRILSALIMFPMVLLIFISGNKFIIDVCISIVALMCIYEIFHAFEQKGHHPVTWIGYIGAISISFLHVIPKGHILILIGAILAGTVLICFLTVIINKTKTNVVDIAITFFGVCYIVIFLMFISIIREMRNGEWLIWYVFIASWLTDVFAYETGKTLGKHHFTSISPNKTIEGCIGGTLGSVLCTILYTIILNKFFGFDINLITIFVIGVLLSIIGQIGDLSASAIKRYAGIKDFSNLIPGHGGMLDRIDSVLFVAPFAYFMLLLI